MITPTQDAFFEVAGEKVTIPVEVRSASMVAAQFLVSADAAQRLVEPTGLRIARQIGGKAICAISAVQYTDNDLGPYHELAVAFVVEPHDAPPGTKPSMKAPVSYIHRLPVNQSFTCEVGKGLWGFPKWICDIDYSRAGGRTRCRVVDDGELIVALESRRGPVPLPANDMEMTSYSFDTDAPGGGGVLRKTRWTTRSEGMRATLGGTTLELGSRHPVADELRSLGLPKRALMTTATTHMTARFGPPEVVHT